MRMLGRRGRVISSWDDWEQPKGKSKQWVVGRSAMEISRAFFRERDARVPSQVLALCRKHPSLAGFVPEEAHAEFETALPPAGSSGPRNHDVWIRGRVGTALACIGVEAKADETFDGPLAAKQRYGLRRKAAGQRSDLPQRLVILGDMLMGPTFDLAVPRYSRLRYQLLAGLAGTAIQASHDGASRAMFVVYEFSSSKTAAELQAKNARDLATFLSLLPVALTAPGHGEVVGPIVLPASQWMSAPVELFVGKVVDQVA